MTEQRFYTPDEVAKAIGTLIKKEIVPTGTNTGKMKLKYEMKEKELSVGWIFSPEDYHEVSDADFLICFMEPNEKCLPMGNGFLPDPMETSKGNGMWSKLIRHLILTRESDESFAFISPQTLDDLLQ